MADEIIEDSSLSAIIAAEISESQSYDGTDIAGERSLALRYMKGEMPDLPASPNGSTQTSRDTPDTISWILPGIVRTMTASDEMVKYEALEPGGEQWAREATEYMNFSFFRENEGYRILYNATYDALALKNGVVSSYWEPAKDEVKTFRDKTEMELAALMEEGWQPISQRPGKPTTELMEDPMSGAAVEVELPTFTVKMQRQTKRGRICDHTCKPENLMVNGGTTIEDARFVAYLHDNKTRSDLMEMADYYGWDRDVIRALGADNRFTDNEVDDARYSDIAIWQDAPVKSGDTIDLYECYIRLDVDGDGIAELVQVFYAGDHGQGKVLGWEEWEDEIPYTDIPCYPVPHRFDGESVADRTMDIQRVKTVLLRQGLNNLYSVNLPMREVEEGSVLNPDILVNPKFGGIIWRKKNTAPIVPHVVPYIADKAFSALEYMDTLIAKRTGVSKSTMALDPETLQNQSATASQLQHDAGYSQIELIARNMAELGWVRFFKKRLKLAIKYEQVRPIPSREGTPGPDGKTIPYRQVTPSAWSPEMACSINVGLGTGSRDRDMSMLNLILNGQVGMADRLAAMGMKAKAVEFIPKIRNTAVKMAESSGLKNPDEYYPEFSDEELAQAKQAASQPQPDPEMMKAQAQIAATKEIETIKAQGNAQKEAAQLAGDLRAKEADRRNALIIEDQKIQWEREKFRQELAFRAWEKNQQFALEREKMASAAVIASQKAEQQQKPASKDKS